MKPTKMLTNLFLAGCFMLVAGQLAMAGPVGTAFTYQGRLIDANEAADGLYDFQFKLFDDETVGNQLGLDVNTPEVDVIDGYFTVELDFGGVYDGNDRWLQIGVRPGELEDPNVYTALSPRQAITPAPYAVYAKTAGGGVGADSDWIITGSNMYSGVPGNVGIGTTSPAAKLDVAGHINSDESYKLDGTTVLANTGNQNIFVGQNAGVRNTTGYYNTFSGYGAGPYNTTGAYNTFSGNGAGYYNTVGSDNTFSGYCAGFSNTTGSTNTFSGNYAGYSNTTGYYNTFAGNYAGCYNTTGAYNTFTGNYAGYSNTEGSYNTLSGYCAGYLNQSGSGNVFLGYLAGYNETGSNKLYIANTSGTPLIYGDFSSGDVGIGTSNPTEKLEVADGTIKATNSSTTGMGIYGEASNNGDYYNYGVFGVSNGGKGRGVYGVAGNTGNYINIGGWFLANGARGIGVYGQASKSGDYENYGGYFESWGTSGRGVYGRAAGSSGVGVYGKGSVGVESEGDLVVSGASSAYRGNIGPNNGAPFPRPAYDSGWTPIAQDEVLTLTHNIGGNVDNYVVDMMFAEDGTIHTFGFGTRMAANGEDWLVVGAYWWGLTANSIRVYREPDDISVNRVRIRIWVYN